MPHAIHGVPTLVTQLVEEVVDSFEKLELVVHLCGIERGTRSTEALARALSLSPERTTTALVALAVAGIVRSLDPPGSGWWLDRHGAWATSVDALARMYAETRPAVIDLVSRTAFAARRRAAREGGP